MIPVLLKPTWERNARMALLDVQNIETYYGPIMAIRGATLKVEEGTIVTILGANGAGKTTILRTISGAMDPRKGTITYNGKSIAGLDPADIVAMGIAHVPEGREVFPHMTVRENILLGAYLRWKSATISEDLEMVHTYFPILKSRSKQHAGSLSGGEQQMLAISRALMSEPRLLLLDEPSLGLSPILVDEIFDIIKRLNQEQKVTILLVEQNARMALLVADFGYALEVGRIVMDGTAKRLEQNEDIREFYLGVREEGVRGEKRWKRTKVWR
jgi:branched-chain amino acid transport system ATP-binding protein